MSNAIRVPSLRHHKPSGRAVVTINGRDHYLGRFGSQESKAEYQRLLAESLSGGLRAGSASRDLTINEVCAEYLKFADSYYRRPSGEPTREPTSICLAIRPLRQLYGHTLASEFGPLRLKAVRQAMIEAGLCRIEINKRVRHIGRMLKWAVSEELVPASTHHGLKAVSGLRRGRSGARESEPVKPVPIVYVEAIQSHVSRQVWAMIQLQLLSGARPGEICIMRTCDIDTKGRTWCYVPESHKAQHHDRQRRIFLGPKAIEILRSWLRPELMAYLFAPAEAEAERHSEQHKNRKTKVQPSQRNRRKIKRRKEPGERYDTNSYRRAITYGIQKANREAERIGGQSIPHWHPHRLRHNCATQLRREFGLEHAKAVLGHADTSITEIYAERDEALAVEAMLQVG
jgi:integrase